ncbi:MAG: diguanylate cyclase [Sporomusaceae bacterium]|nr:diguanylate cyclase [Sporomusaceae bacterium]
MFNKRQSQFSKLIVLNTKKIVAIYLLLSIFFFIFSNQLIGQLSFNIMMISKIGHIREWIYLFLTAIVLWVLLKHYTVAIRNSETRLAQNNIQLTATINELSAAEEKLRQQLSESLRQQATIKEQNEYLLVLLTAIPDLIFHFDRNGFFVDSKATNNMALPPNSINPLIGKSVYDLLPLPLAQDTIHAIGEALNTAELQVMEYHLPVNHQDRYWEARLVKLNQSQVLAIVRDTTQRSQLLNELHYLSLHDHLTGLYNRAYFEQQMHNFHGREYAPMTVFVCDLDGLKSINDTFGHQFGDQLLKAAAAALSKSFNKHDIIARIGGDEFAILLPKTPLHEARAAYQRIRDAEAEYNAQNNQTLLSISVGFAVSSQDSANTDELFLEADNNMYKEKNNHKLQCT